MTENTHKHLKKNEFIRSKTPFSVQSKTEKQELK